MKLYADAPGRQARQVLGDLLLVLWVALWVKLALVVRDATLALAAPGEQIESAGTGLGGQAARRRVDRRRAAAGG